LIARAQTPPPSKPAPAASGSGADLNFDLFGDQAKPGVSPVESEAKMKLQLQLDRKVKLRRNMLQAHQAIGFATLGLLAATLVIGTLNYVDKYGGGDDTGKYYNYHLGLASVSSATFATTGILALAAPNPYPKPIKLDAALAHKVFMALATAAFAAELVLGPVTMAREGKLDQRDYALSHLIVGYGAFGFMAAGTLAYVF
jgi:hypothetical protein